MYSTDVLEKVQFVNEKCTPSEANEIISTIIDDQISFYKLKNLTHWIKNSNCDQESVDHKIQQLQKRKRELTEITQRAQAEGARLNLSGDFRLSVEH